MTFRKWSEVHPSEEYRTCRCNYCGESFMESEILIEDETEKEYCPSCFMDGYIMDREEATCSKMEIEQESERMIILNSCTACGGLAVIKRNGPWPIYSAWAECTRCGLSTKDCSTDEEAAELWNRRVDKNE